MFVESYGGKAETQKKFTVWVYDGRLCRRGGRPAETGDLITEGKDIAHD